MWDILLETLLDSIKLLPFLFLVFIFLEYLEHKTSKKFENRIIKSGKYGPIIGSILGAIPQCGFSVMATNLYGARIISLGTLISIYLSTSDEMLPILISENVPFSFIIKIIIIKVIIGFTFGFIIDFFLKNKNTKLDVKSLCDEKHCDCQHGIFKAALKHTISIYLFIFIASFILEVFLDLLGENTIHTIFLTNSTFGPFLSSAFGLIPSCASSVIITQLYLNGILSYGSMIGGLLTGSGVALLILFKTNKNIKENLEILVLLYFIGSFAGVIINLFA